MHTFEELAKSYVDSGPGIHESEVQFTTETLPEYVKAAIQDIVDCKVQLSEGESIRSLIVAFERQFFVELFSGVSEMGGIVMDSGTDFGGVLHSDFFHNHFSNYCELPSGHRSEFFSKEVFGAYSVEALREEYDEPLRELYQRMSWM